MKVLHAHSGNLFGGIERTFVTLARLQHMCPDMHHHFALCFDAQLSEELRALNAPVEMLGGVRVRNLPAMLRARHRLRKAIACLRPDVIISHAPWAQVALGPAIRSSKIPFVFWLHDSVEITNHIEWLAKLTRPHVAICNSEFTATKLSNLYPNCPNQVIYSPVYNEVQNITRRSRASVREEIGAANGTIVIATTSRLEAWKGHPLLIEALSRLDTSADWECWIAGGVQRAREEEYLQSLKQTAAKYKISGKVKFLGHLRDVYSVLSAADIHCQPNLGPEPFGIAFIEALACGLPVVTTKLGALPQIVNDSCGILVEPQDPCSLAAALTRLIESKGLREKLSSAAPARADLLCNPARQIDKLYSFLQTAVSESTRERSQAALA